MAQEYPPVIENTTIEYLGDESCARCQLGLLKGALPAHDWNQLYLFGDELGATDPYGISRHVDQYYELLLRCRDRRRAARSRRADTSAGTVSTDHPEIPTPAPGPTDDP